ncbi:hypothetical protein ACG873_06690 [Mesorhizobium sp. AaZ16]|uniref:hypothetical protein n=1 Tax=Mesorhizobium sp. AaZ16 TaxID=3402289 RepID=UPI00374E4B16
MTNDELPRSLAPLFAAGILNSILLAAFGQAVVHLGNIERNTDGFRDLVSRAANKAAPVVGEAPATAPTEKQVQSETVHKGRKVTLYTDGSVVAETMTGPMSFASIEEFDAYII